MSARAKRKPASSSREELHRLVDELPDQELLPADRFLRFLRHKANPVAEALARAPEDDEPETPEEAEAVREAEEALARGESISHEQVRRELGL